MTPTFLFYFFFGGGLFWNFVSNDCSLWLIVILPIVRHGLDMQDSNQDGSGTIFSVTFRLGVVRSWFGYRLGPIFVGVIPLCLTSAGN